MSVESFDLSKPNDRVMLRAALSVQIIESLASALGSGFTLHDLTKDLEGRIPPKSFIWRAVNIDPRKLDKLNVAIDHIMSDIIAQGAKNFMRLPFDAMDSFAVAEKNGICIRVQIRAYPPPEMIVVDWMAWK